MDIGLCLNGVRDDQLSVSNTVLFPDAFLVFGVKPENLEPPNY